MQELKIVKKQLVLDLDKNEAPTAWRWRVDRFIKFADGQERIVPDEIAATAEEVQKHIGAAVLKQAADLSEDGRARDTERAAAARALDESQTETKRETLAHNQTKALLSQAIERLEKIARADAQYDAHVRPLFEAEQTRQ